MKVLTVISSADIGGAEIHLEHVLRNLEAIHLVVALAEGPMLERYEAAGADVFLLPTPGKMPIKTLGDLEKIVEIQRPDIIHTHTPKANLMGGMLSGRKRRIMTIHGSHRQFAASRTIPAAWYRWADLWAARNAEKIIAVCEADHRELLASGFPSARTIVINNGVPDYIGRLYGKPDGEILWIGRFSPEKAPETMVAAAKMLVSHPKVARIRMIGGGADIYSDNPKITIELPRETLNDLWPNAAMLVNTSRSEGASLVILEALAAGVPVVASNAGGNPELVGRAGIIVDGDDAALYAAAIKNLMENSELRDTFAKAARERYLERFRVETMIEKLRALYG